MKKFWIGLLSILMFAGGIIFYACDKPKITITLDRTSVDICINDDSDHTAIVSASIQGVKNGTFSVSALNSEIATAEQEGNNIIITAHDVGTAKIRLTDDYSGKVKEDITVNVYKTLTYLGQRQEVFPQGVLEQSAFFAVRGTNNNVLDEGKLLSFSQDPSLGNENNKYLRKNIVWSLGEEFFDYAVLDGNILQIAENYPREEGQSEITVTATDTVSGLSTPVVLSVIDQLDVNDITMEYSYNGVDGWNKLGGDGDKTISIISSKVFQDDDFGAYIRVTTRALDDVVVGVGGELSTCEGLSYRQSNGQSDDPSYQVSEFYIKSNNELFADTVDACFKMEYSKFAYGVSTESFNIDCRPMVRRIELMDGTMPVDGTIDQDIYTTYAAPNDPNYGKMFSVKLTPMLSQLRRTYKVKVDFSQAIWGDQNIVNENTLLIHYGDKTGVYGRLNLYETDQYVYEGETPVASDELYLIANGECVRNGSITGVSISIQSLDNQRELVEANYDNFNLVCSTTALDFGPDQLVEKTVLLKTDTVGDSATKSFVLEGQTSDKGIEVKLDGISEDDVLIEKFASVQNDSKNIVIDVKFTAKANARGKTIKGSYYLQHPNGMKSANFDLELYLPLLDAQISFTQASAITKQTYGGQLYELLDGQALPIGQPGGVSSILMRNGNSTLMAARVNQSGNNFAQFDLSYSFLDFNSSKFGANPEDAFLTMSPYEIYLNSLSAYEDAPVAGITGNLLTANNVGLTYLVAKFDGRGADGKDTTLFRIILLESYIAPSRFSVTPNDVVTVFAQDSVASGEEVSTTRTIVMGDQKITDLKINNFTVWSKYVRNGEQDAVALDELGQTLDYGNYSVTFSALGTNENGLTFTVAGITTNGLDHFKDELHIVYRNREKEDTPYEVVILIDIVQANRIESVTWENQNADNELYFEIVDDLPKSEPQYLIFTTTPTNARNNGLELIVTDENGATRSGRKPVETTPIDGEKITQKVELVAKEGMSGYIFVLPSDAIYNGVIYYYFGDDMKQGSINVNDIFANYDDLVNNAYFINNGTPISFANILLRIKVRVADGSVGNPLRIYTENQLRSINTSKHYQIMNDLTINDWASFSEFEGSLQGANPDITITFEGNSSPFVNNNRGEISNLKFAGNVRGGGFVANENNGNIHDVVVDVYNSESKIVASTVQGLDFAGAIVGTNKGTLLNVKSLGVSVAAGEGAANLTVGGIAGQNFGNIENARVEIYKFTSGANKLDGNLVGGVVGILAGGTLKHVYAYDYALSTDGQSNLSGSSVGALVGKVQSDASVQIVESFAVVNIKNVIADVENGSLSTVAGLVANDIYTSYYTEDEEGSYNYFSEKINPSKDSLWTKEEHSINGGYDYLVDFHQDLPLQAPNYVLNRVSDGDFDKALPIGEVDGRQTALFYYYQVKNNGNDLDYAAAAQLQALNTISIAQLTGSEDAGKLVASSSDPRFVSVVGGNLIIKNVTNNDVEITLYSRYDFSVSQTIRVRVIYALSALNINIDNDQTDAERVTNIYLQRGKTKVVTYTFKNENVYLGNSSATAYELVMSAGHDSFEVELTSALLSANFNGNVLDIVSNGKKAETSDDKISLTVWFEVGDLDYEQDAKYFNAIKGIYAHNFTVQLQDGALSLELSNGQLPISPSLTNKVVATLRTSKENDKLIPYIDLVDGEDVVSLSSISEADGTHYVFAYAEQHMIDVDIACLSSEQSGNEYIYTFELMFSVDISYRELIDQERNYSVVIASETGVEQEAFALVVARQGFANVNLQANKVTNYTFGRVGDLSGRYIYEISGVETGIIAPGDSVILTLNVNPSYASYHHIELTCEGGDALGAVELSHVYRAGNSFYHMADNSSVVDGRLVYVPIQSERQDRIYFLLHTATQLNNFSSNVILNIEAKFIDGAGNVIPRSTANRTLVVSVLQRPLLSIKDESGTISYGDENVIAKGESVTVQLTIPNDSYVELDNTQLSDNVRNVQLSSWRNTTNENTPAGFTTFESTLTASVEAQYTDEYLQQATSQKQFSISVTIRKTNVDNVRTERLNIQLVDFKIDHNNITLVGGDNVFVAYNGIQKDLTFNYPFLPSIINYDRSDADSQKAYDDIKDAQSKFVQDGYYANETLDYYINYQIEEGSLVYNEEKPVPLTMDQRLYYLTVSNGIQQYVPVFNPNTLKKDANGNVINTEADLGIAKFRLVNGGKNVKVQGSSTENAVIRMQLRTTIMAGNVLIAEPLYNFSIIIQPYYDEDKPSIIDDADDFNKLDPDAPFDESVVQREAKDYILMNDIHLSYFKPFDTTYIKSLDGNGFTIYIDDFAVDENSAVTMALFNNVESITTLKNIRVNWFSASKININVANSAHRSNTQIAGFAITNDGVITNCEVVSFASSGVAANETGLLVTYTNGINDVPVYTKGSGNDVTNFTSSVAGFVINNTGSITNSRVGGDEITLWTTIDGGAYPEVVGSRQQMLLDFTIRAQGDVSGFVLRNSGQIASSFVKNVAIQNESATGEFDTAGFVIDNAEGARISTSYVEGREGETVGEISRLGAGISSKFGVISGFVTNNQGAIKDAYSNILISNNSDGRKGDEVYLAAGFVYDGSGTLENCFSASQIAQQTYTQMNFSGVNAVGEVLFEGTYTNCYYYSKTVGDSEKQFGTGAVYVSDLNNKDYFYGFSLTTDESQGVWDLDMQAQKLTLTEANYIALSNRRYEAGNNSDTIVDDYTLSYTDNIIINGQQEDLTYGTKRNPILIRDAADFVDVTGASARTPIRKWFTDNTGANEIDQLSGNYRFVDDISLRSALTGDQTQLLSWQKAFTGAIYGNGFSIQDISIAQTSELLSYGLFASIEGGTVFNLNMEVTQVRDGNATMVGALAGYVSGRDIITSQSQRTIKSNLVNLNITFNDGGNVHGLNFVGGLAGFVSGDVTINNVVVNSPNVTTSTLSSTNDGLMLGANYSDLRNTTNDYFKGQVITALSQRNKTEAIRKLANFGFAGGVIGFADVYGDGQSSIKDFTYNGNLSEYQLSNLHVNNSARVIGLTAGGVLGFVGPLTNVKDAGIVLNAPLNDTTSLIYANQFYAGGVVGQSMGTLTKLFAEYSVDIQNQIEGYATVDDGTDVSGIDDYYSSLSLTHERGSTTIFDDYASDSYLPKAIGGLIGVVESGTLSVSYSKLNATSARVEYAGGLIGLAAVSSAASYVTSDLDANNGKLIQQYYINQAYASGDVRGASASGGIIGKVEGIVTLDAVNSANFFSLLDYSTGENYVVDNGFEFKDKNIYSLVGELDADNGKLNLSSQDINSNDEIVTERTVGAPKYYTVRNHQYEMEIYPGQAAAEDFVFFMPDISSFNSSADGYEWTYPSFLGSSWWQRENWIHDNQMLYPRIRFSLAEIAYVYLDCDNVDEILPLMDESNIEVRVRGRKSMRADGTYDYADVDLRSYFENHSGIEQYRGNLVGWKEGTVSGENRYPGLILNTPMFRSVSEGFRVSNLDLYYNGEFKNYGGETGSPSAAFVNAAILSGTISNVKFDYANLGGTINLSGSAVGLLATEMVNSSIYDLTLDIDNNSTFMDATPGEGKDFYAGLVAGRVTQSSEQRNLTLARIKVQNQENGLLMHIGGADTNQLTNSNVGGIFGRVEKSQDGAPLSLKMADCTINAGAGLQIDNLPGDIYFGGQVGYVQNVDDISIESAGQNVATINLDASLTQQAKGLYAGTLFGKLDCTNAITLTAENPATLAGEIKISAVDKDTYIGGVAGQATGSLTLENVISKLDVSAFGKESPKPFQAKNIYAGGYVGEIGGAFIFNGKDIDALTGSILARATNAAKIGGLVGHAKNPVTVSAAYTSTQTMTVDAQQSFVGGVVGQIEYTAPENNQDKGLLINDTGTALLRVDGTIEINRASGSTGDDHRVGGIVGDYNSVSPLNIYNTSFGGLISFKASSGTGYLSGKIGSIMSGLTELTIRNSYDYGDVFVEKDGATITYGGLIGNAQVMATSSTATIEYNYILTTYYNEFRNGSAGALFGQTLTNGSEIKISDNTNYYSHAVCLLTDDQGVDAGYMTPYSKSESYTGGGYNYSANYPDKPDKSLKDIIVDKIINPDDTIAGQKLNPIELKSDTTVTASEESNSHGITYYYVSENGSHKITRNYQIEKLTKTAIIGDTYTVSMVDNTNFVGTMGDKSFISGLNLSVNIETDKPSVDDNSHFGGLVDKMEGGIIYAVGVTGIMDIGTYENTAITMGGMVGEMTGGYIGESFTDVEMTYRAGQVSNTYGTASAFAGTVDNAKIEYSYAVGTVKCFIDAHIEGFAISLSGANIGNCYTTANLEWNDYTSAKTEPGNDKNISVFSGVRETGGYIDKTYNNNKYLSEAVPGKTDVYAAKNNNNGDGQAVISLAGSNGWDNADYSFNYGYPTRQFNFLKTSSYFTSDLDVSDTESDKANEKQVTMPAWYKKGYNKASEESDQQKGILKAEYVRAEGEALWGSGELATLQSSGYFAIPNAERWRNASTTGKRFILRNDLHMDYSHSEDETSKENVAWLDGQGHRIYNLTTSLFVSLNGTVVNLDILDAEITGSNGILAKSISGGTYSNITLSGHLAYSSKNVGALAGSVTGANLYNIMNNTKIDAENAKQYIDVGGIAGTFSGGLMAYCVNNGPIVVSLNGGDLAANAGGLVGIMMGGDIAYSYNTTSVANGYTKDQNAAYTTGGIAGEQTGGTIDHCYNSGMIKSGNKSVASANISYAGGIAGNSERVTITNCINEGPVEALGKNPEWHFKIEYYDKSSETLLTNPSADQILEMYYLFNGELCGALDLLNTFYLNIPKYRENIIPLLHMYTNSRTTVQANGIGTASDGDTCANKGSVTNSGAYDNDSISRFFPISHLKSKATPISYRWGLDVAYDEYVLMELLPDIRIRPSSLGYYIQDELRQDVDKFTVVSSVDSLGAPRSFYLKTSRMVMHSDLQFESLDREDGLFIYIPPLNDYRSFDISNDDTYAAHSTSVATDRIEGWQREAILAPFQSENETHELVNIAGGTYCYANNGMDVLNAAENNYTATITVTVDQPKYVNDQEVEFEATVEGYENVTATVTGSQEIAGGKTQLTIKLSSEGSFGQSITDKIKITCSVKKTIEWNLEGLVYSYWESAGRVAIDLEKSENTTSLRDILSDNKNTPPPDSGQYYLADLSNNGDKRTGIRLSYRDGRLIYDSSVQTSDENRNLEPSDFASGTLTLSYTHSTNSAVIDDVQISNSWTGSIEIPTSETTTARFDLGGYSNSRSLYAPSIRKETNSWGHGPAYSCTVDPRYVSTQGGKVHLYAEDGTQIASYDLSAGKWDQSSFNGSKFRVTYEWQDDGSYDGITHKKLINVKNKDGTNYDGDYYCTYEDVILNIVSIDSTLAGQKGIIRVEGTPIAYYDKDTPNQWTIFNSSVTGLGSVGSSQGQLILVLNTDKQIYGGLHWDYYYQNKNQTQTLSGSNLDGSGMANGLKVFDYSVNFDERYECSDNKFNINGNEISINFNSSDISKFTYNGYTIYYDIYYASVTRRIEITSVDLTFAKEGYYGFSGTSSNISGYHKAGDTAKGVTLSGNKLSYSVAAEPTVVDLSSISDEDFAVDHEFTFTVTKTEGDVTTTYAFDNEGGLSAVKATNGLEVYKIDSETTIHGDSYEWQVKLGDGTYGFGNIANGKLQWKHATTTGDEITLGEEGDPIDIIEIYKIIEDKETKKLNVFVSGGDTLGVKVSFTAEGKTVGDVILPDLGESINESPIDINGRVDEVWSDGANREDVNIDQSGHYTFNFKPDDEDEISLTYTHLITLDNKDIDYSDDFQPQKPHKYGIILTRNVNVGALEGEHGIDTVNNVINGNDHTISYYTNSDDTAFLIKTINNNAAVKTLSVAGQLVKDGAILAMENSGTIANVSVFGNIRNATGTASGVLRHNEGIVDTVSNYAYINGADVDAHISGIIDHTWETLRGDITNCGMLIGARGQDGTKGEDDPKNQLNSGNRKGSGGDGQKGGDVYAISANKLTTTGTCKNEQYIFGGAGGNAGRGGNGAAGKDWACTWIEPGGVMTQIGGGDVASENNDTIIHGYFKSTSSDILGAGGWQPGRPGDEGIAKLFNGSDDSDDHYYKLRGAGSFASGGNGGIAGFVPVGREGYWDVDFELFNGRLGSWFNIYYSVKNEWAFGYACGESPNHSYVPGMDSPFESIMHKEGYLDSTDSAIAEALTYNKGTGLGPEHDIYATSWDGTKG